MSSPPGEEQLLAMAAPALESMDNAFSMLDSVDLDRGEVEDEDGNRVKLTDGLFARMRESRDRRVRADAFAALHGAFQKMGNTIAALYAGQVKADVFAARARGYADSLDAALFADALPRSIYTGLIGAVRDALPVYFRYLELRRRLLGVDRLHIYDCYIPVVEMPETAYTYEQARDVVLDTLRRSAAGISGIWRICFPAARWMSMKPRAKPPAPMRRTCTVCTPICC